jgi:hypothetical protein
MVPEGCYTTSILTARSNAAFCFRELYAAVVQEDQIFEDVPQDTLAELILQNQAEDHTTKKTHMALSFTGGYLAVITAF